MGFKRLEEIEVWKRSCRLAVELYKLTKSGEFEKDWGLRDQIRRAAVSIPSNIAEGYERDTAAEFNRFAMIARGSCGELRTQLYITQAIGYLDKKIVTDLINECIELSSMITSLGNYLKSKK
jgi:four helix bundle protein